MTVKPCIQCGKECEILPVQLGDIFTLTYLRICSSECMFLMAYDYLYEIGYHKSFRGGLYDKQDPEDAAMRKEYIDMITQETLREMKKNFEANPNILSTPAPENMLKIFGGVPPISKCFGETMRFTRPTKEQKIIWQSEHVERLKESLRDALYDLEKLENE